MAIEFDEMRQDDGGVDHSGRRRLVAGVAAVMLIAGAAGVGYGIGRNVEVETAGLTSPETVAAESGPEVTDPMPDPTPDPMPDVPASTVLLGEDSDASPATSGFQGSGEPGYAVFGSQPLETLFERTTSSGAMIRAQLGPTYEAEYGDMWDAGDWRPPPWCSPAGQLRIALEGNGVVDVGGTPWYSEPFEGRSISWVLLGGNDGAPQWAIVVQVPPDATSVRVDFADGSTDEVQPQNGVAVLTGPGEPSMPVTEGGYTYWVDPIPNFQITIGAGEAPVVIGSGDVGGWDNPDFRRSCTPPPPALPQAGEQPADPRTADAEIRVAMTALYGAIGDQAQRGDLVDDPTGIADARQQVQDGGYADQAASAEAVIDELVFTSPTEAWFRYHIDTAGSSFDNRYGIAVLADGGWKITRATICQDLSLAGGDCGPGWEPVFPPGAFDGGEERGPATTFMIED